MDPDARVDLGEHAAEVRALADKYERMLELRGRLGRGVPSPENRLVMRELARRFPGALRELDRLATEEMESRLALVRGVTDTAPAWLLWTARYHARMRIALADPSPALRGRRNVRVFDELALEHGVARTEIWQAVFPTSKQPPHRQK